MPPWWKLAGDVALSLIGIRTAEEPAYEIVARLSSGAEIRQYGSRLAAETTIEGSGDEATNTAFRRLAGYIFGKNSLKADIAMTAPVETARDIAMTAPVETATHDGRLVMRFFLPASLRIAEAPRPNDPAVAVVELPAQKLAVLRFSGTAGPERIAEMAGRLDALLAERQLRGVAPARLYRYDPPMTPPFLRRNEIVIPLP